MRLLQCAMLYFLSLLINATDDDLTLDGSQYISYSMITRAEHRRDMHLSMVFKTTQPSGLLFFANGVSGDFILLELYSGRIRFASSSTGSEGSPSVEIIYGVNFADGDYHQINVEIGETTTLTAYMFPYGQMPGESVKSTAKDLRFDLDVAAYFAGMPESQKYITAGIALSRTNFEGCLNVVSWNKRILNAASLTMPEMSSFIFHGPRLTGCNPSRPFFVKTLASHGDSFEVTRGLEKDSLTIDFYFRTYVGQGTLFSASPVGLGTSAFMHISRDELHLVVDISSTLRLRLVHQLESIDDGCWRRVRVNITAMGIVFLLNDVVKRQNYDPPVQLGFPGTISIGAPYKGAPGFIGCLKDIRLGADLNPLNHLLPLDPAIPYLEQSCQLQDQCFPTQPCKNFGRCYQNASNWRCDCDGTGFSGLTCEDKEEEFHQASCASYYSAGYHSNGIYVVKPGDVAPFEVFCNMSHRDGPSTVIHANTANADTFVFTSMEFDDKFYFHPVSYKASKDQIRALVRRSAHCRQFVRYNCYKSTLLDSSDRSVIGDNGIRWYSRRGTHRRSWGSTNSSLCSCGVEGSCIEKQLACNCDAMRSYMLVDEGYLTDTEDLPVSMLRVSTQKTNHRSSFFVGSLECFDSDLGKIKSTSLASQKKIPVTIPALISAQQEHVSSILLHSPSRISITGLESVVTGQTKEHINCTPVVGLDGSDRRVTVTNELLCVIIACACSTIIVIMFMIVTCWWRRRLCFSSQKTRQISRIIVVYGDDALPGNTRFGQKMKRYGSNMDLRINSIRQALSPTIQRSSSSDESVGSTDLNRYLHGDCESVGSVSKSGDGLAMKINPKTCEDFQKHPCEAEMMLQERCSSTEYVQAKNKRTSEEFNSEQVDASFDSECDDSEAACSASLYIDIYDVPKLTIEPRNQDIVDHSLPVAVVSSKIPRNEAKRKTAAQQRYVDRGYVNAMYDQLGRPHVPQQRTCRMARYSLESPLTATPTWVGIEGYLEEGLIDCLRDADVGLQKDVSKTLL